MVSTTSCRSRSSCQGLFEGMGCLFPSSRKATGPTIGQLCLLFCRQWVEQHLVRCHGLKWGKGSNGGLHWWSHSRFPLLLLSPAHSCSVQPSPTLPTLPPCLPPAPKATPLPSRRAYHGVATCPPPSCAGTSTNCASGRALIGGSKHPLWCIDDTQRQCWPRQDWALSYFEICLLHDLPSEHSVHKKFFPKCWGMILETLEILDTLRHCEKIKWQPAGCGCFADTKKSEPPNTQTNG